MVTDLPRKLQEAGCRIIAYITGDLTPDVVHAAPYLVYLSPDSKFADHVLAEAFGKS